MAGALPQASDLQRRALANETPNVRAPRLDFSPLAQSSRSIEEAGQSIGRAISSYTNDVQAQEDERQKFETERKLLDFKLQMDDAAKQHRLTMQPGGEGYTDSLDQLYKQKASEFVGDKDANIPKQLRGYVGVQLTHQRVNLLERARTDQMSERERTDIEGLEQTLGRTRSTVEADPSRRDEMRAEGQRLIEGSPTISPAAKDRLRLKYNKTLDDTAIGSRILSARTADDYKAIEHDLAPSAPERVIRAKSGATVDVGDSPSVTITKAGDMSVVGTASGAKLRVANQHADRFAGLLSDLQAEGITPKADQSGGYNPRTILGTSIPSKHATGEAVDINWSENEQGKPGAIREKLGADKIREIAARNGLKWGGDFKRPDDMHFEVDASIKRDVRQNPVDGNDPGTPGPVDDNDPGNAAGQGHASSEAGAYAGPYQHLTLAERRHFYTQLQAQRTKQVNELSTEIKEYQGNAALGKLPPNDMLADLDRRVVATGEPKVIAAYTSMIQMADITRQLVQKTPVEVDAIARSLEAQTSDTSTPEAQKQVAHVRQLADSMKEKTNKDPLTWVSAHGVQVPIGTNGAGVVTAPVRLQQLDFNRPDIVAKLKERREQGQQIGAHFVQPAQFFTQGERDYLSDQLKLGGNRMVYTLGKLAEGFGEDLGHVIKEIAPKSPEAARAGFLVATGGNPEAVKDIARTLERKADPNHKLISPHAKDYQPHVDEVIGDVYRNFPKTESDSAVAAAVAIYENRVANGKPYDADVFKQSLRDAMGERADKDGQKYGGIVSTGSAWGGLYGKDNIILPSSMRQNAWREVVTSITTDDLKAAGLPIPTTDTGQPVPMLKAMAGKLVQTGAGRYAIAMGDPSKPGEERWLMTGGQAAGVRAAQEAGAAQRKPFEIDLGKLEPILRQRFPTAFLR